MRNGIATEIGCFVAGAVAGGIIVALATPYSGPKIRRMLRHKVQDGAERFSETADEWKREIYHRGSKLVADARGRFQHATAGR